MPELDRAGFCAISFNDQGSPLVKYKWTVPGSWPQTPQAAEYMAVPSTLGLVTGPSQVFGYCLNVVRDMAKPWQKLGKGVYASLVKKAQGLDRLGSLAEGIIKAKAHKSVRDCVNEREIWETTCNTLVDEGAKEAVGLHPAAPRDLVSTVAEDFQFAKDVIALAMAVYQQFPRLGIYSKAVGRDQPGRRAKVDDGTQAFGVAQVIPCVVDGVGPRHNWEKAFGVQRCRLCFALCENEEEEALG